MFYAHETMRRHSFNLFKAMSSNGMNGGTKTQKKESEEKRHLAKNRS